MEMQTYRRKHNLGSFAKKVHWQDNNRIGYLPISLCLCASVPLC